MLRRLECLRRFIQAALVLDGSANAEALSDFLGVRKPPAEVRELPAEDSGVFEDGADAENEADHPDTIIDEKMENYKKTEPEASVKKAGPSRLVRFRRVKTWPLAARKGEAWAAYPDMIGFADA